MTITEAATRMVGLDPDPFALAVAQEIRGHAGFASTSPIGISVFCTRLGIRMHDWELGSDAPGAIAVHSPDRTPLIVVNRDVLKPSRELQRRWAVVAAISGLLQSATAGKPWAGLPTPEPSAHMEDRLALEIGIPGAGLDDLMLGTLRTKGVRAASRYYGMPLSAVALQLKKGRAWGRLLSLERDEVEHVLQDDRPDVSGASHLREVRPAA
jgi:hypothetical protein